MEVLFVRIGIVLGLGFGVFCDDNLPTFTKLMSDDILLEYDKTVPPPPNILVLSSVAFLMVSGKLSNEPIYDPSEVRVGMYVNSMAIDSQNMKMELNIYLRQQWQDRRLQFDSAAVQGNHTKYRFYGWDDIWRPDIFHRNGLAVQSLPEEKLLTINNTGWLWFVEKQKLSLACPMILNKFPADTQPCSVMIESFGYTMDVLYFGWLDSPVSVDRSIEMPGYTLEKVDLHDCSQNYTSGAFPCLEVRFLLRRDTVLHLKQTYLPSCLAVVLSWLIMFVDNTRFGMRLLIGSCLEFLLFGLSVQSAPDIDVFTASDVWIMMCMIFVFAVIAESTVAKYMCTRSQGLNEAPTLPTRMDQLSCIILPIVFIFFLIIYFSVYFG